MGEILFFEDHGGAVLFTESLKVKISDSLTAIAKDEEVIIKGLTYIALDDEALLLMNKNYLNHDFYTDVITFDLSEYEEINGEVYISVTRIKDNAVEYNVPVLQELCRVIYHGLLHLVGYDDKEEKSAGLMREKENFYLNKYCSTWNSRSI